MMVLYKMPFHSKVRLFQRFSDDYHESLEGRPAAYEGLVESLKDAANLRNMVVHAEWEVTDDEGYTHVSVRISNGSMAQEYIQFSQDSLNEVIAKIERVRVQFDEYWEARDEMLASPPTNLSR